MPNTRKQFLSEKKRIQKLKKMSIVEASIIKYKVY
jgi:hypothetical protein